MKRLIAKDGICKIYYTPEFEEYSILIEALGKEPTYFTDDKSDAFDTMDYINRNKSKYGFYCKVTTRYKSSTVLSRKFYADRKSAMLAVQEKMNNDPEILSINITEV